MSIQDRIKEAIRDVPDFPKPGIVFKDITPILSDPALCDAIAEEFAERARALKIDAIACIDARGFLFGMLIAQKLDIPFVPIRKAGKLPYEKYSESYELEYGTAEVEIHSDALQPGWKVIIHDDLLATGGTAIAAAKLVARTAEVVGFSFLVNLSFLQGEERLKEFSSHVTSIVSY